MSLNVFTVLEMDCAMVIGSMNEVIVLVELTLDWSLRGLAVT